MAKKSLRDQARAMFKEHLALKTSKADVETIGETTHKQFTSLRSFNEAAEALGRIGERMGVSRLKHITTEDAQRYLLERVNTLRQNKNVLHHATTSRYVSQKTSDAERKALSILLKTPLAKTETPLKTSTKPRSYTNEQIREIQKYQTPKNALSTRIAQNAGLRASELLTLRRKDELKITSNRSWNKDRFKGENGIKYVVTGKGGLIREVILSKQLAHELEQQRRAEPATVLDRGIKFESYYDIVGGNAFSQSFSSASNRALGFSNGAHGLRHQYVQSRMTKLKSMGHTEKSAKLIVSQEVGHFRASVTNVYLK